MCCTRALTLPQINVIQALFMLLATPGWASQKPLRMAAGIKVHSRHSLYFHNSTFSSPVSVLYHDTLVSSQALRLNVSRQVKSSPWHREWREKSRQSKGILVSNSEIILTDIIFNCICKNYNIYIWSSIQIFSRHKHTISYILGCLVMSVDIFFCCLFHTWLCWC